MLGWNGSQQVCGLNGALGVCACANHGGPGGNSNGSWNGGTSGASGTSYGGTSGGVAGYGAAGFGAGGYGAAGFGAAGQGGGAGTGVTTSGSDPKIPTITDACPTLATGNITVMGQQVQLWVGANIARSSSDTQLASPAREPVASFCARRAIVR